MRGSPHFEVYYPLYVEEDDATVTVNGGIFSVDNNEQDQKTYSICVGSPDDATVTSIINITGGTFNAPLKSKGTTEAGKGIAVSGGTVQY